MLTFKTQVEFRIGDIVYVKTDVAQLRYVVTNYVANDHQVLYEVSFCGELFYFNGFELSTEEDTKYRIDKM